MPYRKLQITDTKVNFSFLRGLLLFSWHCGSLGQSSADHGGLGQTREALEGLGGLG